MAGGVAEVGWETSPLPRDFSRGGSAVCVGDRGEGEIPDLDAHAGEFHGMPGDFLLPNGQSLPSFAGGSSDGGWWVFG